MATHNEYVSYPFFFKLTYLPLQTARFSEVLSILDFSKTFYLDCHLISLKTLFQFSQLDHFSTCILKVDDVCAGWVGSFALYTKDSHN